jgi:two-component system invasion response regulator UvrY
MEKRACAAKEVRILVIDDHFVFRQGVKAILVERYPNAFFGESSDAQDGLDKAWNAPWDVILLDINMPGRGGMEVLAELRRTVPKLPVIILSMHSEEQFAVRAVKLGAAGYIGKDVAGSELVRGVEAVLRDGKYITPSVAMKLADHLKQDRPGNPHEALSDREYQVLCLLGSGKRVKEIAGRLSLSVKTISTYRGRILEKMNMEHNADIMRYVLENKLIEIAE